MLPAFTHAGNSRHVRSNFYSIFGPCAIIQSNFRGMPMDDNKAKALAAALQQIEKQFGKGSIMKMGDAEIDEGIQVVSTGSLGLDIALGIGGLPRGRVVEIYGPESSGKTTLTKVLAGEALATSGSVTRTESEAPLVTEPGRVPLPLSEDPRDFLANFTGAVQTGDVDWLLGRLNPAVIQRYGEEQCRGYLRTSVIDPTMRLQLSAVAGPGSWEWSTDDRSTVVDEVYRVDAHRFLRGTETTGSVWLANVDGTRNAVRFAEALTSLT